MTGDAADVPGLVNSKGGLKYQGPDLDAMRAIASASADRSLKEFEDALTRYKAQLGEDPIINAHLQTLYDNLLVRAARGLAPSRAHWWWHRSACVGRRETGLCLCRSELPVAETSAERSRGAAAYMGQCLCVWPRLDTLPVSPCGAAFLASGAKPRPPD